MFFIELQIPLWPSTCGTRIMFEKHLSSTYSAYFCPYYLFISSLALTCPIVFLCCSSVTYDNISLKCRHQVSNSGHCMLWPFCSSLEFSVVHVTHAPPRWSLINNTRCSRVSTGGGYVPLVLWRNIKATPIHSASMLGQGFCFMSLARG